MIKVFTQIDEIHSEALALRELGLSIGFVPTMGALHEGHISLLQHSIRENDVSISSIFVNPIQFNNKEDLKKYPRKLDKDINMLDTAGCDMVFAPSVEEMYPGEIQESYDFGALEHVMEGDARPGHFNGVAVVVNRLFNICIPHRAYFGEKDFQQLLIIREMVKKNALSLEIIGCPIIREPDGLAMSSRNVRLSADERSVAPVIFQTLSWIKKQAGKMDVGELVDEAGQKLSQHESIKLDYVWIADEKTLMPVMNWHETSEIRAFIALFLGEVRLIDNMKIK
ncbi:MAG: pantoate--beta-alanine ligase [Bacteroidales bacterium]|nr:pantoate--beta-alanine ligase [Bacteroidales bacterium]